MGYDSRDRLTAAVAPGLWGNASYSYDGLDNLTQADQGARKYRYAYASNQHLSQINDPNGITQFTFGYDAAGNVSLKNNQAYGFDIANRLTQVTGLQTYRYDGLGRRVQTTDADGSTTFWQYSQAGQVLYASEARKHRNTAYIYLGNTQVAAWHIAWSGGPVTIEYEHTDALGSPVAQTDPTAAITSRESYAPYGEAFNAPIDGPGYTGHVMDAATGLTYMQQRYYDPTIGRFLSVDPVTANGNTGGNFNRYWYANNSPYKFTDPDGRCTGSHIANDDGTCASTGDFTTQGFGPTMPGAKTVVQQASIESQAKFNPRTAIAEGPEFSELSGGVIAHLPDRNTGRLPDYAKFSLSYYVLGGNLTFARNRGVYLSLAVGKSLPHNLSAGGSFAVGWLDGPKPSSQRLANFLTGPSLSFALYDGIGGGRSYSDGAGWATEVGAGESLSLGRSPAGGPSGDMGWTLPITGPGWGW